MSFKRFTVISMFVIMLITVSSADQTSSVITDAIKALPQFTNKKVVQFSFLDDDNVFFEFVTDADCNYGYYQQLNPKSGTLSLLVIFDRNLSIAAIAIPDCSGMSSRLNSKQYLRQFLKKEPDKRPLKVAGTEINAISGATLSSKMILENVNREVKVLKEILALKKQ